jgi:hypothetical protein
MIKLKDLLKEVEAKKPEVQTVDLQSTTNAVLDFVSKNKTQLKKLAADCDYDEFYKLGFDKFPDAKQGDVAQAMNAAAMVEGWFTEEDVIEMPTDKDLEQAAFGDKKLQKGVDTAAYDKLAKLPKNTENIKEALKKKGKVVEMANTDASKVDSFLNSIKATIKNNNTKQQIQDFIMIARLDPYASFKSLLSDLLLFYNKNSEVLKLVKVALQTESILKEDGEQYKLDDLSNAFQSDSVESYVNLLKKYQSDPKILAALKAGLTDGKPNDEKFNVAEASYAAKILKPTQNEIGAEESLKNILTDQYGSLDGFLKGNATFPDPIITYNGKFVLDGHHRWSQVYAANPNAKISAINVTGKIDPKDILKAVHTAIAVDSGETKTISANLKAGNLLAFTPEKVKSYVDENLTEKARNVWADNGVESDNAIANRIVTNVKTMLDKSKPEDWAPSRDSMPQPGVSNSEKWGVDMKAGKVNLITPKTTDAKKESVNKRRDSMLKESIINLK